MTHKRALGIFQQSKLCADNMVMELCTNDSDCQNCDYAVEYADLSLACEIAIKLIRKCEGAEHIAEVGKKVKEQK